jgi:hypothetical protein
LETQVGGASLSLLQRTATARGPNLDLEAGNRGLSSRKDTSPTQSWREVLVEFGRSCNVLFQSFG